MRSREPPSWGLSLCQDATIAACRFAGSAPPSSPCSRSRCWTSSFFGAREAAWPLIRRDLELNYAEVGLLLGVSAYAGTLLEPVVGLLGDTRWRRAVVAAGGLGFSLALGLAALSDSFWPLLVALVALFVGSGTAGKLALVGALGLATAGWYSIPKARLYGALPGQSGAAVALGSLAGVIRALAPLAIGFTAERYGLGTAMWLLLAAPVGLLVLLPRT